jgi:alkanesulfonate monooxygenase SsuD/methylene tetrahydromethanopterin reductase-like flavin-dependent oxidoreductase (luciferase family)
LKSGISILWRGATINSTREIAREADRLEFEYLWLTEAWGMEALSTTGYLLGITSQIKIGVGVLNVYSRSAALIGMACATLDQIAPSRFVLGLGSSGKALVERWHGVEFSKPIQRTKEYIEIIRRVTRGENLDNTSLNGKQLSGFRLYTKAMNRDQEIYIGAIGDRNLKIAGEISDGAIVTMYPISRFLKAIESLGAGKKLFAYLPVKIVYNSEEEEKARREVARNIGFYVSSMGRYYASNLSELGFAKSVEKITSAYTTGGDKAAADAVDDELMDELSLIGSPDQILDKMKKVPLGTIPIFAMDSSQIGDIAELRLGAIAALARDLSTI